MKKPCSCQGENPNCYKCGGRGYVHGFDVNLSWSAPLPKHRRLRNTSIRSRVQRPAVSCPECGVLVTKLSKHLRKVHNIDKPAQPPAGSKASANQEVSAKGSGVDSKVTQVHRIIQEPIDRKQLALVLGPPALKVGKPIQKSQADKDRMKRGIVPPGESLIHCSSCKARVIRSRLASHIARVHPGTQELMERKRRPPASSYPSQKAQKPVLVSQLREDRLKWTRPARVEDLIQRSSCKASVKRNLLFSHVAGSHPGTIKLIRRKQLPSKLKWLSAKATKPPRTSKPARVKMNSAGPSSAEINKSSWKQQFSEETLDFSRPFAHAFREQGKFGSYPSHDDFGDESKP